MGVSLDHAREAVAHGALRRMCLTRATTMGLFFSKYFPMPHAVSLWHEAAYEMDTYEARDAWEERVAELL